MKNLYLYTLDDALVNVQKDFPERTILLRTLEEVETAPACIQALAEGKSWFCHLFTRETARNRTSKPTFGLTALEALASSYAALHAELDPQEPLQ